MKFSEYLKEAKPTEAKSIDELVHSIQNGKFTKDGSKITLPRNRDSLLAARNLKTLVGGPSKVEGDFRCSGNQLTSLEGSPQLQMSSQGDVVTSDFFCNNNKLTTLEGGPIATNFFSCANNKLTTLEHCPEYINNNFSASDNPITSLKDIHKQIKLLDGILMLVNCPLKSHILGLLKIEGLVSVMLDDLKLQNIINKHLQEGRDIFACQQELIDAGYEDFAQL